ncbi:phage minor capsid protein [Enterococcus sp. LJL99]
MSRANPDHLNSFSSELINRYEAIELELLKQITKRLKAKGTEGINEWYIDRMNQSRLLNSKFYKELERNSGVSSELIGKAIEETAKSSQSDIDSYLKQVMSIDTNMNDLDQIMQAYQKQVFVNLDNYVNQTLVSTMFGDGPIMKMYENILNNTMASFGAGNITLQQAIEKAIISWADKGIPSSFIDKGGNTWSLERYVDTVMRSTLNRLYNEVRTSRMEEYGITTVKMSVLLDAAPRCAHCQGRVLDMRPINQNDSEYPSIYEFGYGLAGGTLGINCRHSIYPFIPGVNIDREPNVKPEEAIRKSRIREKQREIERRIRKTKKNIIVSNELKSPNLEKYQALLRKQQSDMRELLKDADWLRRNYGREKVITPKDTLMKGSL